MSPPRAACPRCCVAACRCRTQLLFFNKNLFDTYNRQSGRGGGKLKWDQARTADWARRTRSQKGPGHEKVAEILAVPNTGLNAPPFYDKTIF